MTGPKQRRRRKAAVSLTPDELTQAAVRLYGPFGWIKKLAEDLNRDRVTVYRWLNGQTPIPGPVAVAIRLMLKARK